MKNLFSFLRQRPQWSMLLAILWTLLIFWGCSMPGKELPKVSLFDNIDKVVHASFFFVFFIFWNLSCAVSLRNTLIVLALSIIYGFGIEYYQLYFVAGRSFDVWDGIADTFGAFCGYLLIRKSKK